MLILALPTGAKPPAGVRGLSIQPEPPGADAAGFPENWRRFNVSSGGCVCALYAPAGTPADEGHGPDLTLRAQAFLRDGFPPHTTVWICDKGGKHARGMDR